MSSRRLAAIMFTDMVGYTALMQSDEAAARQQLIRQREVCSVSISRHGGNTIQHYGDGALTTFPSTIEAVLCAIEIQRMLRTPPPLDIRIGIHAGDIITDETGIYGDGVNVASRIETLAVPGSILISERVHEDVSNQSDIATRDMGFFEMKNVRKPMRVFAVANPGLVIPGREEMHGKTKVTLQSLAVLPFMNMSGDPENTYFSDGITEELINALTAVEELHVISRTSVFALKGKHEDIRKIGAQLNVDRVLEGSVRKAGNRVRITAQLINAADGFHIWSETFDRDLTDIFQVQDEISQIITNRLRAKLLPGDKEHRIVKQPTSNLEAYSLYLKGKYHQNMETPDDTGKAIGYYEQAIALQPDFALPHAHLAGCYALLGSVGAMPASDALAKLNLHADTSLKLDPYLADAHVAKATGQIFFEWNWDAGYRSLMRANELNPGSMTTQWILGYYYLFVDEPEKAIEILEVTCKLDPLAVAPSRTLGFAYFFAERYADAMRLSDMQLEMAPANWFAMSAKAFAAGMLGDWGQAVLLFRKAYDISQKAPMAASYLAFGLGKIGKRDEAMKCIAEIEAFQAAHPEFAKSCDLFVAWWGLGDFDKAFEYAFKAVERKEEIIAFIVNSPVFDQIRDDPRYREVRRQMGFQDAG